MINILFSVHVIETKAYIQLHKEKKQNILKPSILEYKLMQHVYNVPLHDIKHASSVGQRNTQTTTGVGGSYSQLGPRDYEHVNEQ